MSAEAVAIAPPPAALDPRMLADVVARILRRTVSSVHGIEATPIRSREFDPVTAGLFRVRGVGLTPSAEAEWSVVLKICRTLPPSTHADELPPDERERVRDLFRWDREARAYGSGLLDDLVGLRAPRSVAAIQPDGSAWLWLEDVMEHPVVWDAARYGVAARHLGLFNGSYLAGRPIPDVPWLTRDWIRTWSTFMNRWHLPVVEDDAVWSHPLVRASFPSGAQSLLRGLARDHAALLARLDRLPQTLAHLDAFRGNLIARDRDGERVTVAIDWSYLGVAAVGAEASQLVTASVFYHGETADLHDVDDAVWHGYLDGLRDAGWEVDRRRVRVGYLAANLARWPFIGLRGLASVHDEDARRRTEAIFGMPLERVVDVLGRRTAYLGEQARELRGSVAE